jgi:hypothetical protein
MTREMDQGQAITLIVIGSAMIVVSFFVKNFYAARGIPVATVSDQKIPIWMGRLLFCVVGSMMILGGLVFFFPNQ